MGWLIKPTDLRMSEAYVIGYTLVGQMMITFIIPLLTFFITGILIFRGLRNQPRPNSTQSKAERSLAFVLIWTVVMFVACHAPRLLIYSYEAAAAISPCLKLGMRSLPHFVLHLLPLTKFLIV